MVSAINIDGDSIEYGNNNIPAIIEPQHKKYDDGTLYIHAINEPEYSLEKYIQTENGKAEYRFYNSERKNITPKPLKKVDKYWGYMTTLVHESGISVKEIIMNENTQSSLEFHLQKKESYIIEFGKLKVGFRVGRAINKSIIMHPGQVITIPVGTMHMRMALEETKIIEISTTDFDSDSHLVEDGKLYKHIDN